MLAENVQSELHSHPFIQFLYAREGVLYISVAHGFYIMPACYGLWIPAYVPHQVHTASEVMLERFDIESDYFSSPGEISEIKLVVVNDFARSFIHYITQTLPESYDASGKEGLLISRLLDVLNDLPTAQFSIPWPSTPALLEMCQIISESLDSPHLLGTWAKHVGMSSRTFSRHFIKETGTTFSSWKRRNRLLQSIVLLRQSRSVTEIALILGYSSTSAYTYAFRQFFGVSPSRFEVVKFPVNGILPVN
jgi:AraC-like DNA-binding protein